MHSAHVGDARKIARTLPESVLNAARSGSRLDKLTWELSTFVGGEPAAAGVESGVARSHAVRIPPIARAVTAERVIDMFRSLD